jgi:hypothetical protein
MAQRPTHYQKRSAKAKGEAVGIAVLEGVTEAERQTGIPKETIHYWLDEPEFAQFRTRARDEMATDVKAAFLKGLHRTVELLAKDTDLRAVGDVTDKLGNRYALLSGEATARTEHRDLTDGDDAPALAAAADAYLASLGIGSPRVGRPLGTGVTPDGYAALPALPVPGSDTAGRLT